jgi:hypothetical protein
MADDLTLVQPGDLITADLLNAIIRRVQGTGPVDDGKVDVPNVFGRTLGAAVSLIGTPGSNVQLGTVLDSSGTIIAPSDPTKLGLVVVGQVPSAGVRVMPGTGINLVIAVPSATTPLKLPTVTGFSPATQSVGGPLQVIGTNFDLTPSNNSVTINGRDAGVPGPNSNGGNLFVAVPTGADAQPQPATVVVTTPTGTASNKLNITAATGPAPATITSIGPVGGPFTNVGAPGAATPTVTMVSNTDIVINGTGFGTVPSQVTVFLGTPGAGGVPALSPSTGTLTASSMTVHLPPLAQIPAAFRNSSPVVQVGAVNGLVPNIALAIV